MCNRYVDGLGTWAPQDLNVYRARAEEIVEHGYSAVTEMAAKSLRPDNGGALLEETAHH
jgi:hypothetical protein